jgi:hypothetical protein
MMRIAVHGTKIRAPCALTPHFGPPRRALALARTHRTPAQRIAAGADVREQENSSICVNISGKEGGHCCVAQFCGRRVAATFGRRGPPGLLVSRRIGSIHAQTQDTRDRVPAIAPAAAATTATPSMIARRIPSRVCACPIGTYICTNVYDYDIDRQEFMFTQLATAGNRGQLRFSQDRNFICNE